MKNETFKLDYVHALHVQYILKTDPKYRISN